MSDSETKNINPISSNILDKVMGSQTQSNLSEFQPTSMVNSLLLGLKQRDREILGHRFGLAGMEIETLEAIGKKFNLTRERVRQIEKDSLAGLRKNKSSAKDQALSLIFDTILEHGHIMSEEFLIQIMLLDKQSESETAAFKFLLNIGDQLSNLKETGEFYESWYVRGFDLEKLKAVIDSFVSILEAEDHVVSQISLYDKFRDTEFYREHVLALTEWGYKKGVVADVIKEILRAAGKPLNRDEIISEVMKKRQVKRNTILVGLSNRKNFTKVGKDKYQAAPDGII